MTQCRFCGRELIARTEYITSDDRTTTIYQCPDENCPSNTSTGMNHSTGLYIYHTGSYFPYGYEDIGYNEYHGVFLVPKKKEEKPKEEQWEFEH